LLTRVRDVWNDEAITEKMAAPPCEIDPPRETKRKEREPPTDSHEQLIDRLARWLAQTE
jgi:hypothetical protein